MDSCSVTSTLHADVLVRDKVLKRVNSVTSNDGFNVYICRNLLTKNEIEMFTRAVEEDEVENKSFARPDGEGGELT